MSKAPANGDRPTPEQPLTPKAPSTEDGTTRDDIPEEPEEGWGGDLADDRPGGWRNSRGFIFGEMLIFASLSLLASWVLSYDAILLADNPQAALSCNANEVLNCSKVGISWQAKVFGFPNAFLGMIAEPVVMTIAVASLARTRFPRWFMVTANAIYLLGVIFAYWLLSQSMFVIHALCPWCMLVTLSTTLVFTSMLHWNILENNIPWSAGAQAKALSLVRSGAYHILVGAWIVLLAAAVLAVYGPRLLA